MQMQGSFNSAQYEPSQSGGGHPPALKAPFTITSTAIKENSSKDGGFFEVEFTSPAGSIIHRYNIWNKTPKAVEIAHGQLSALCRATGRYTIDWSNEGAALRGGQGLMDVGYQKGEEPSLDNPNAKGYTELKKVYDLAGNEPGKSSGQAQPAPQQAQQPVQQGGANWQQGPAQTQTQPSQPPAGWNGSAPNPNPAQQAPQGQVWQPGGAAPASNPPWGSRT